MAFVHPARNAPTDAPATALGTFTRAISPTLLATRCATYRAALAQLERFAKHDTVHVLLVGESGTGKTIFAEHLHACSPRAGRVFHRVALSAVADSLVGSELFGHLPGAFTDARSKRTGHFASAHGGTLFLDEIGKASLTVQYNLLDAVERHEIAPVGADRSVRVDVRLIAASNVSLHELAKEGKFLPDLLARLDGFVVQIPPLRERRDDIPLLVAHLTAVHAPTLGYRKTPTIDSDLMEALTDADWPGNVRELEVTVRRLLIEGEGAPIITLRHCTYSLSHLRPMRPRRVTPDLVVSALQQQKKRNVAAIARTFGISRTTVYDCIKCAPSVPTKEADIKS